MRCQFLANTQTCRTVIGGRRIVCTDLIAEAEVLIMQREDLWMVIDDIYKLALTQDVRQVSVQL